MKILLGLAFACGLFAQDTARTSAYAARFDLVATRAAAYQRSADTIEARLNEEGLTLHPETMALRMRVGAALDQARHAIEAGQWKEADRALSSAEALVDRLAKKLGG
ncbi:MAG: hypothetical protein LAO79_07690 [Acidobacteriia bacterium]|nr:hypothetical protein [Terriglobia bacterium]